MVNVIIVGAGGHGAELDEYISLYNKLEGSPKYKIEGFLDDNAENYERYQLSGPLLGGITLHKIRTDCFYIMGIANLEYKKKFVELFLGNGARFLTFVHPTAYVSPSAKLGDGVIIAPFANIGPNVKIGDFTLVNSRASLGHDVEVGSFNFIAPNVCFSGFTKIGNENLFGIGSLTIPHIEIGNNNKISAGMVVDKNVHSDEVVFHRFKEKVIAVTK